jgi:hypothetical protein
VALGPTGENGLAHLGLLACSAEIGEGRPRSLAVALADSDGVGQRGKGLGVPRCGGEPAWGGSGKGGAH